MKPNYSSDAEQAREWAEYLANMGASDGRGTVGAVVLDRSGNLAAATSTGGGKFNFPGRVSDSATVAGNYASGFAAVSCTGFGEEIVDDGLAVRLETRVRDGLTLIQASDRVYAEALERRRQYGWIGIERRGTWVSYWTTEEMQCAGRSRDVGPSALFPL